MDSRKANIESLTRPTNIDHFRVEVHLVHVDKDGTSEIVDMDAMRWTNIDHAKEHFSKVKASLMDTL